MSFGQGSSWTIGAPKVFSENVSAGIIRIVHDQYTNSSTATDGGVTQQNLFQLSASSYSGSSDEAMLFVSANANNALDLNARIWHIDGGRNANGALLSIDATHKLRNSAVKIKGSNTLLQITSKQFSNSESHLYFFAFFL